MEVEIIEKVENISLIRLPIEGFENLSLNDKLLSYHLWHAGISGDEIIYQQLYRHGLEIRNFFLDILEYKTDIPSNIYDKLELFAKQILINKGIHNTSSGKKFSPSFTKEELHSVINDIKKKGFKHKISSDLEKALFDPDYDVMIAQKTPPAGKDILTASSNTFYPGIKLSDMEGFEEKIL